LTELDQVMERQFVGAALITGIHRLRGAEIICNLLLGFVGIFAQITHDSDIFDATPSPLQIAQYACIITKFQRNT